MRKLLWEMILDLGKGPNNKMHESESAGALLKVRNPFQKQFLLKCYLYNCYSKFCFPSVSVRIEKSKRNGFPIVFPKK